MSPHHPERLDPGDLAMFAGVAEAGSFARAAQQLGMPRSTVSRRVAELEEVLGERLFVRSTRTLRLTEFGRCTQAHAARVAEAVSAATAFAQSRQSEPSGRLRVSMPAFLARTVVAEMLDRFMVDHPRVTLDLDLTSRRVDLLEEDYDLVVHLGALDQDASLTATLLAELPNGLYASPRHLERAGAPTRPGDLAQAAGLLISRHDGTKPWALVRRHAGAVAERWTGLPQARCLATSGEILLALALADHGIVALPDVLVRAEVWAGRLQRVLPPWRLPGLQVWAVIPGRQGLPNKTRAFLDGLRAEFTRETLP